MTFVVVNRTSCRCTNCGLVIPLPPTPLDNIVCACGDMPEKKRRDPFDCDHLGEYIRDVDIRKCRSCPGNMQTSLFECDVHESCTPYSSRTGFKYCLSCTSFTT